MEDKTKEELAEALFEYIIRVASGEKVKAEKQAIMILQFSSKG